MRDNKSNNKFKIPILTAREITVLAAVIAIIEVGKMALSFLPNIEIVTLLIILFSLYLGPKVLLSVAGFVIIEGMLYGFGIWWISYLYIWPLLALITIWIGKNRPVYVYALLAGLFGFTFGAASSIPNLFIGGINAAVTWWVAGIPYDIIHGISNFAVMFLLYRPLNQLLCKLKI